MSAQDRWLRFSSITDDQFERFAAKARLPTKLTLDTVHETVAPIIHREGLKNVV